MFMAFSIKKRVQTVFYFLTAAEKHIIIKPVGRVSFFQTFAC